MVAFSQPYREVILIHYCFSAHVKLFFFNILFKHQDFLNIIAKHRDSILDLSLMSNFQRRICIIMGTKITMKMVQKHGSLMAFLDGTYGLIKSAEVQVVPLVVAHTKENHVCIYFCINVLIFVLTFLFCFLL